MRLASVVAPSLLLALGLMLSACAVPDSPEPGQRARPAPTVQAQPAADAAPEGAPPAPAMVLEPEEEGPVRVALLVPLSGRAASAGEGLFNAAQLALFETGGPEVELMPLDTQGTPEGAAAAAREAVAREADVILGPLFSASVKAAAPVARAAGLPVIAFTTDRTAAGGNVFVMGFLPGPQVERVVGLARERGMRRFAVLAPDNAYGNRVVETLQSLEAADAEMTLADIAFYDPAEPDASEQVRRLTRYEERQQALRDYRRLVQEYAAGVVPRNLPEGTTPRELARQIPEVGDIQAELRWLDTQDTLGQPPFDAIIMPDEGARLRNVAALLPYYDVDTSKVRLLGTMLWDDPSLAQEPALVGGWYPARPPRSYERFIAGYRKAFGAAPPSVASLAYDATALVAVLAAHPDLELSERSLRSSSGFAGIDGIFRFRPDGTAERGLAVMEIAPGETKIVDPAPASFEEIDRRRQQREADRVTVPSG